MLGVTYGATMDIYMILYRKVGVNVTFYATLYHDSKYHYWSYCLIDLNIQLCQIVFSSVESGVTLEFFSRLDSIDAGILPSNNILLSVMYIAGLHLVNASAIFFCPDIHCIVDISLDSNASLMRLTVGLSL